MMRQSREEKGIIGRYEEDGFPIILRLIDEMPGNEVRKRYTWLTVISWHYDGGETNGMPPADVNDAIVELEGTIEESLEAKAICRHAYSRTGKNLKELVCYVADRDEFIDAFNAALADHPRYPIEINFYHDPSWNDLREVLAMFQKEPRRP